MLTKNRLKYYYSYYIKSNEQPVLKIIESHLEFYDKLKKAKDKIKQLMEKNHADKNM